MKNFINIAPTTAAFGPGSESPVVVPVECLSVPVVVPTVLPSTVPAAWSQLTAKGAVRALAGTTGFGSTLGNRQTHDRSDVTMPATAGADYRPAAKQASPPRGDSC